MTSTDLRDGTPRSTASTAPPRQRPGGAADLSVRRLSALRGAYLFFAVGIALVKWPVVVDGRSVPLMDGVVAALLTAMSLLALVGLRYPVRMLPVLLLEVLWKLIWLSAVALPAALADDVDDAMAEVAVNCSFVVVVVVLVPWRYVWQHYAAASGDRWR